MERSEQALRIRKIDQVVEKPIRVKPSKRKLVAYITESCTGCGGSPVCMIYCKSKALELMSDPENYPFKIARVVVSRCTGCGACVSGGALGAFTTGCPWGAVVLLPREEARTIH